MDSCTLLTRFFPSASKAEAMASKMMADLKPELGNKNNNILFMNCKKVKKKFCTHASELLTMLLWFLVPLCTDKKNHFFLPIIFREFV